MVRKYFGIPEAEDLLPSLAPLLNKAQRLKNKLERYEQVTLRKRIRTDGSEDSIDFDSSEILDADFQAIKEKFYQAVEKIESKGCIVRDLDEGVLDFYAQFEGREVFLCWRQGEKRITHWHEADEGYAGRKRILEL